MQMKYLSLALAAALATTLTACGSDSSANNNVDLTPVKGATTPGTDTKTPGTDTKTPGTDTKTPGTDDQTEEDKKKQEEEAKKKEEEAKQKQEAAKVPEGQGVNVPDPVNNPGNAVYQADAKETPSNFAGQYVRGAGSLYDRSNNSNFTGNATVPSFEPLQNQEMTNFVFGRESGNIRDRSETWYRFVGQDGSTPNPLNHESLQSWNALAGTGRTKNGDTLTDTNTNLANLVYNVKSPDFQAQDSLRGKHTYNLTVSGRGGATTNIEDPKYQRSNVDIQGRFRDTATREGVLRLVPDNGLVAMYKPSNVASTIITGQEDQVVIPDASNPDRVGSIAVYGQNSPSRILGANYSPTDRLRTDRGGLSTTAQNEANSWVYLAKEDTQVIGLNPTSNSALKSGGQYEMVPRFSRLNGRVLKDKNNLESALSTSQIGKNSWEVNGGNSTDPSYSLAATAIKLNDVQYGRVTNNIDPVPNNILVDVVEEGTQAYLYAPFRNKFNYNVGGLMSQQDKQNDTVDTYFYRGTNETSLEQMAAIPANAKLTYNGHAITYGIDNSYHGGSASGKSNSFTFGKDKIGLGNFVTATYDRATNQVNGNIYNVWLTDKSKADSGAIDKLVSFEGKVVGNSVVDGTSKLEYGTKEAGSFKASFFGPTAAEIGGSVNSIPAKYGNSKWGAVFGAQQTITGSNQVQYD